MNEQTTIWYREIYIHWYSTFTALCLYNMYCRAVSVRMHIAQLLHKKGDIFGNFLSISFYTASSIPSFGGCWDWRLFVTLTVRRSKRSTRSHSHLGQDLSHIKGLLSEKERLELNPTHPLTTKDEGKPRLCMAENSNLVSLLRQYWWQQWEWQVPSQSVRHHTRSPLSGHSGIT